MFPYPAPHTRADNCLFVTDHCQLSSGTLAPQPSTMLFKALSAAVYGIDANLIDVEVDYSGVVSDQDHFHTVGLPDAAVRESRDRVRAAIKNSGYIIPPTFITINLAPADIKKEGSGFDLPIAVGILGAYGALRVNDLEPLPPRRRARPRRQRAPHPRHVARRHPGAREEHSQPDSARRQRRRGRGRRRRECLSRLLAARCARTAQHLRRRRHSARALSRRHRRRCSASCSISPSTSAMCAASKPPSARSKWPRPAATTFS